MTASVVSTSSGFSVSGMSGSEAALVFINDAALVFMNDASNAMQASPQSAADPATLTNAIVRVVSEYGFDNESSAFIATALLRQQSNFTLKMTQQREAFEACIESFKSSAAAQMELQLVQLSVSVAFVSCLTS